VDSAVHKVQNEVNETRKSRGEEDLDIVTASEKLPSETREHAENLARERNLNAGAVVATLGVDLRGKGKDEQARPFAQAAAEWGDAMAAGTYGLLLEGRDRDGARRWFRRGAENGDTQSQYNLGRLLYDEAQEWLERASADPEAAALLERIRAQGA
jgi:TPR repeat protein